MTFVRTRLLLERMKPGETAEIRLRGGEPLTNVPRAVASLGHRVLALEAEGTADGDPCGPHRLILEKAPPAAGKP